ncbi:HU family DNA-binding protein [Litorisediminicola beolgyonensis]|uniref:HU family DNA-binding protein n=1 Tax=Litorisediminicola beolgyonensis TaxID=1173614 RepID=A0ABW3ZGG4_9RHOB
MSGNKARKTSTSKSRSTQSKPAGKAATLKPGAPTSFQLDAGPALPEAVPEGSDAIDQAVEATLDPSRMPRALLPEFKKKELIDAVVERSGLKKRDVKPVLEAALAVLGEALSEGRELNLEPFGKIKVQKVKQAAGAQVMVTRIRQSEPAASDADRALAQVGEDG